MVYAMYTFGDEKPLTLPKGCEYLKHNQKEWLKEPDGPEGWGELARRWPVELPEQRPTAFGLLSEEEQEELKKACEEGKIQVADSKLNWGDVLHPGWHIRGIYRIKPEPEQPEQPEITVTVNGELIDFLELVRQEIARIQGE